MVTDQNEAIRLRMSRDFQETQRGANLTGGGEMLLVTTASQELRETGIRVRTAGSPGKAKAIGERVPALEIGDLVMVYP